MSIIADAVTARLGHETTKTVSSETQVVFVSAATVLGPETVARIANLTAEEVSRVVRGRAFLEVVRAGLAHAAPDADWATQSEAEQLVVQGLVELLVADPSTNASAGA